MYCPECGTKVSDASEYCSSCGYNLVDNVGRNDGIVDQLGLDKTVEQITETISLRGVKVGALAGIVTYLVGFLLLYRVLLSPSMSQLDDWTSAGLSFYAAHGVSPGIDAFSPFVFALGGSVFAPILPPFLLMIAGGLSAKYIHNRGGSYLSTSVGLAIGYLVLAVLARPLFTETAEGIQYQPELLTTILYMGLFYPLFFGSLPSVVRKSVGSGLTKQEYTATSVFVFMIGLVVPLLELVSAYMGYKVYKNYAPKVGGPVCVLSIAWAVLSLLGVL